MGKTIKETMQEFTVSQALRPVYAQGLVFQPEKRDPEVH